MVEQVIRKTKMQSGMFWRVLGLCFLSVGALGQDGEKLPSLYGVTISGNKVVLTCPEESESEEFKWEFIWERVNKDKENVLEPVDKKKISEGVVTLDDFSEINDSGLYCCNIKKGRHCLYLKAKVCENCLEVDLTVVTIVIVADLCVTLGLLLGVYHWSKNRKAKVKPVTRATGTGGRPRGQTKERPPPVPNPDYEPIRKGQQELYSGLSHRGV